ncbi:hypothetical protein QUA56_08865 [Microcoleus sp. N3A4]|uniref:hypothetical protein n=1 Tax=Microcoleus sp. N3A4 TaxID=3055379 RepID=UPI002FCF0C34
MISIPVVSELILPEIRTRHCRVPTIDRGRDTAVPCPLSHSGAAGIHTIAIAKHSKQLTSESIANNIIFRQSKGTPN